MKTLIVAISLLAAQMSYAQGFGGQPNLFAESNARFEAEAHRQAMQQMQFQQQQQFRDMQDAQVMRDFNANRRRTTSCRPNIFGGQDCTTN